MELLGEVVDVKSAQVAYVDVHDHCTVLRAVKTRHFMLMSWSVVTRLAEIKVGASHALVSVANDRGDIAEVTLNAVVNGFWRDWGWGITL